MSEHVDRIKEIIAGKLNCDPSDLKNEALLIEDLGADSLDMADLLMALEEDFEIELDANDNRVDAVKRVQDVIDLMEIYLQKASSTSA